MNRAEIQMRALHFLYTRYEAFGPQPHMISREELHEAVIRTGVTEPDLRRAFRELEEDGLAEGHPRPGAGMHPEDGLVWISPAGRRRIEALPANLVFSEQIREQVRIERAGQQRLVQDSTPARTTPQSTQPDPLGMLHPQVARVARPLFLDGHFRQAVFDAWLELNKAVQEKSGRLDLDGVPLMELAFSPKNPLLKFEGHPDEQFGYIRIFSGGVLAIRNPRAHAREDNLEEHRQETLELLAMISALFRVLDRALKVT